MNYIDRTKLELQNITLTDDEITIRLQESGISDPSTDYNPSSNTDKKAIYTTVLSILESIANDPQQMRTIREEDQSISDVSANLLTAATSATPFCQKIAHSMPRNSPPSAII